MLRAVISICAAIWLIGQTARAATTAQTLAAARDRMVDHEIVAAGVKNPRVIDAMRATPRHEFVPMSQRGKAYFDMALAIGDGQTISPPFIVAYMTEQLDPQPGDKVLEIGTGSGYQAAVLSPLVKEVYTIEIVKPLGQKARRTLQRLKYANVFTKIGDGYQGWPEHAPFDKIIVTCSPESVPPALVAQLREDGRLIVPVGQRYQQTLYLFQKKQGKLVSETLLPALFVPMTGTAEAGRRLLPDPASPAIFNGGFEKLVAPARDNSASEPANKQKADKQLEGWHYQRQLEVTTAADARQGERYATFRNDEPGRSSCALQGMAIDGRKVSQLEVALWVKAKDLRQGASSEEMPGLGIIFYDQNRAHAGNAWIGPWRGSFDWQEVVEQIRVPAAAREAIVRVGLHGATGEVSLDDLRLKPLRGK